MADERETRGGARRRLGVGAVVVLGLGALALTVGAGILRTVTAPQQEVPLPTGSAVSAGELYVHVSGAVRAPGLYRLPAASRVVDAVAAAGGFADDADRAAINLARGLKDGEQLVVSTPGAAPSAGAGPPADGRVNLNTADVAALDTLPRIGPALAQRIVDWREQHGAFTAVEELGDVPGFGDKLIAGLTDLVTV